jgi:hypothetical protein
MSLTKVTFAMIQGEYVNVFDYMTPAQIADVQARTTTLDVTAAVQAALDSNQVVYFPAGVYKITATLTGKNCRLLGEPADNASILKYTATNDTPLLSIEYDYDFADAYTSISQITLQGPNKTANTGVYLYNAADIDDIDAFFTNVFFDGFNKSIHIVGRGLKVSNCSFVVTTYAVYLDREASPVVGPEPDQKIGSGARVYRIENCRFHAMGAGTWCVANISPTNGNKDFTRGIQFVGNYIDTTCGFMIGAFRESLFTSNQHLYPDSALKVFDTDGGNILYSVITGNTFSSWPSAGGATARQYQNILYCDGNVFGLTFTGNTVRNVNEEVFYVTGNVGETTIASNTFSNVMLDADTTLTRVVFIDGDVAQLNFTSNSISRDEVTATTGDVLVYIDGTATFVDCSHNSFNTNDLVASNKGGFFNFSDSGNRVAYLGDVPTTGTWRQGDIVWDTNPAAGTTPGWVCVTAGTPGTWKAMANLAA